MRSNCGGSLRFLIVLCRSYWGSWGSWFSLSLRNILRNIISRSSRSGLRGDSLSRGCWGSCSCGFVVNNTLWKSSLRFIVIHWCCLRSRRSGSGFRGSRLLSGCGCSCGGRCSLRRCWLLGRSWLLSRCGSGCSLGWSRLLGGCGSSCGSSSSLWRSGLLGRSWLLSRSGCSCWLLRSSF